MNKLSLAAGTVILLAASSAGPLAAQPIKFPASFDQLAKKASEVVDVTMDAKMLQLASKFLSGKDADEAQARNLVSGLRGIFVRSFEFDKEGQYADSDIEAIRSQVQGTEWSRLVNVRSHKSGETAEVYLRSTTDKITGLVVIAAEPKELTVVSIDGPIDPSQLNELSGHFGVPKMHVGPGDKKATGGAKK
jgi:hypothetical protein